MDLYGALANIGFDWRVALANLVNFLIIFWILKKFVFGPLQSVLARRRKRIEEGVENAKKAERDRVMAKRAKEEEIKKAQVEANEIIKGAREKERSIVEEARGKAEDEADAIIARGHKSVEQERAELQREVRKDTAALVIDATEQLLGSEIDEEKNEELIRKLTTAS